MAFELAGKIRRNAPLRREAPSECLHLFGQTMIAFTPQTDVQVISFAETPAVPFQVLAKIKFGLIAGNSALRRLHVVHFELDLLRADRLLFLAQMRAEKTRHRTEVPARADH